jgi:hypothetical protein
MNGGVMKIDKSGISYHEKTKQFLSRLDNEEITLGNIRIVKLEKSPDKILLQYTGGGTLVEGGQFDRGKFEKHIENFFHENF